MRNLILLVLFAGAALCQAAEPPTAESGWLARYYGGAAFWFSAGTVGVPGPELQLDLDQQKWPAINWDAAKGPLFIRDGGWSVAAYARLRIATPGAYRFASEGGNTLLRVNGRQIDPALPEAMELAAGEVAVALFVKPAAIPAKPADNQVRIRLLWQPPGTDGLVAVPADALVRDNAAAQREQVYTPDILLDYAAGEQVYQPQRRFTVELPAAGLYEIASHFSGLPRCCKVDLDGQPLLYLQSDRQGVADPLFGATDRAGTLDSQRLDFLHRARAVRQLQGGRHTLDVFVHYGPWVWDDEMQEAMRQCRIGITRVGAGDPLNSLAVQPKGRSDLVCRRGEPLVIGVARATASAQAYRMQVTAQRGDGAILWEGAVALDGGQALATGEFSYPCDREGAFHYTVRDAAGRAVDGPWAFVVVDPTPAPRPRLAAGAAPGTVGKVLVDSVDCTQAADPGHLFRDNGTSRVVAGPDGPYRVTGTAKLRPITYLKDGDAWRRTRPGEKGQAEYYAADWFAYTLKVQHPGRAHLLIGQVPNDVRRLVSMYAIDQITGQYNGWVLDAGDAPEARPFSPLAFVVWPNSTALDVSVWCSNDNHNSILNRQGAVARLELYELPDGLPALPEAAGGWTSRAEFGWEGEQVDLGPNERTMPSLWAGDDPIPSGVGIRGDPYHDWKALQTSWERFGQFSAYRGDNLVSVPVHAYGMNLLQGEVERMLPRISDIYSSGYRARMEDPFERDIFKMMLLIAQKYGVRLTADFMVHRLEGIAPVLARQAGVPEQGILLTDCTGKIWRGPSEITMLNPAHPVARKYLIGLMDAMGRQYGSYPAFAGVRIRGWTGWPSGLDAWFYDRSLGYDDATVAEFTKDTGVAMPAAATGPDRCSVRRDFLLGERREAWLAWRCKTVLSLREEMLAALRRHSPAARLFSDVTGDIAYQHTGLTDPRVREAGLDARQVAERADLGWSSRFARFVSEGVEWNAPDPVDFANFDQRQPASVRRNAAALAGGQLNPSQGFDYPQGMCSQNSTRSHPYQLQGPALALAEGKLDLCSLGGPWCLPPADEGLRSFVQAWRAIPPLPYVRYLGGEGGALGPVACWSAREQDGLVLYLVNRTARRRQVDIFFDREMRTMTDLVGGQTVTGGRKLRLDLDAFMPAVLRVDGVQSISDVLVPAHVDEVAKLGTFVEHLRSLRAAAEGGSETILGPDLSDDGDFGRGDVVSTFAQLFDPIETAWNADRPHEVARLLDGFHRDHLWWYEAYGWPADLYVPQEGFGGQHIDGSELQKRLKAEGEARFQAAPAPFAGDLLMVPSGKAVVLFNPRPGRYHLRMWGLFGGDYGPIRVEFDGKPVGRLGEAGGVVRQLHRVLPVALPWPWSPREITLISEGGRGLAIGALEVTPVPPSPIRHWSAIGIFDKQAGTDDWAGMEKIFPPEQDIDLSASYPGLGGKPATWREIDLGERKFLPLADLFPYDVAQGNGAAYLATWIFCPDLPGGGLNTQLYHAMDWYGKAWLNGQLVMPRISGPWKHFASQDIRLQLGWNCLLVKTSTGRGGWKASFAIGDPGNLIYSSRPPAPAKP